MSLEKPVWQLPSLFIHSEFKDWNKKDGKSKGLMDDFQVHLLLLKQIYLKNIDKHFNLSTYAAKTVKFVYEVPQMSQMSEFPFRIHQDY